MNCYMCESDARRRPVGLSGIPERPAVAVCHECGSGVCLDHAVIIEELASRSTATRLFACSTCALVDVPTGARRAA
jgi:hypothetical protein